MARAKLNKTQTYVAGFASLYTGDLYHASNIQECKNDKISWNLRAMASISHCMQSVM